MAGRFDVERFRQRGKLVAGRGGLVIDKPRVLGGGPARRRRDLARTAGLEHGYGPELRSCTDIDPALFSGWLRQLRDRAD